MGHREVGCIMHNAYCIGTMTTLCSIRLVYYGKKRVGSASDCDQSPHLMQHNIPITKIITKITPLSMYN
jgi:hypothetical protein